MCAWSSGAEPRPIRWLAGALAVAHAAWIWTLSSQSIGGPGGELWSFLGNSFHFVLFGVLAILLAESCRRNGAWTRRALLLVLAVTVAYGVVDELHQRATPGRSSDPADVVVDFLGAVGALALWWGVRGPGRVGVACLRATGMAAIAAALNLFRLPRFGGLFRGDG